MMLHVHVVPRQNPSFSLVVEYHGVCRGLFRKILKGGGGGGLKARWKILGGGGGGGEGVPTGFGRVATRSVDSLPSVVVGELQLSSAMQNFTLLSSVSRT